MKPRIRLKHGVWSCASVKLYSYGPFGTHPALYCGYGYTPAEAFADWKAQQ